MIVAWGEVIVSPGKYEDENMFPYIVEVWRCENKEMIFETLGSRVPFISFVDQAGCDYPIPWTCVYSGKTWLCRAS